MASDKSALNRLYTGLQDTVVETVSGKVRGYKRGSTYIFKGIPYGASTSGKNRFMPPSAPLPWTGIRNCLSWGPSNPDGFGLVEPGARMPWGDQDAFVLYRGFERSLASEDCLRLNVWTPQTGGSKKRAVMVYMHGGGFSGGSGNDLQCYDGTALSESHDVVVVTHNHRLNVFGYLNLTSLDEERFQDSANVGMLDIVAVLQWVKNNIEWFGGDPNRVMIFGQSGGGGKVKLSNGHARCERTLPLGGYSKRINT
jgi:para-nitrobenzyl esterase